MYIYHGSISRNVRIILSANPDFFFAQRDIFDFAPYEYSCLSAYLFTEKFLVDNIYDSFINNTCKLRFLPRDAMQARP